MSLHICFTLDRQEMADAQQQRQDEKSMLEKAEMNAALEVRRAARRTLEQHQQQWQSERDALVEKMTHERTAAELQVHEVLLICALLALSCRCLQWCCQCETVMHS